MAKNWKVGEAARAIQAGNKEDILDIGRRFPLFANLAAQANDAGLALLDCVPEYVSARKIESVLKGDVQETEVEDEVAEEEAPAKKAPAKAEKKAPAKKAAKKVEEEAEEEDDSLESKSAKELFDMCKEAGLKVKPKQDKEVYIKALKDAEKEEDGNDDDWDEEEEEPVKKAPAKKAAPKKAPAKKAADDEDDDWDV